jgi:hypothetical protein
MKALERIPDFRYRTCAELLQDLDEIANTWAGDEWLEK